MDSRRSLLANQSNVGSVLPSANLRLSEANSFYFFLNKEDIFNFIIIKIILEDYLTVDNNLFPMT